MVTVILQSVIIVAIPINGFALVNIITLVKVVMLGANVGVISLFVPIILTKLFDFEGGIDEAIQQQIFEYELSGLFSGP